MTQRHTDGIRETLAATRKVLEMVAKAAKARMDDHGSNAKTLFKACDDAWKSVGTVMSTLSTLVDEPTERTAPRPADTLPLRTDPRRIPPGTLSPFDPAPITRYPDPTVPRHERVEFQRFPCWREADMDGARIVLDGTTLGEIIESDRGYEVCWNPPYGADYDSAPDEKAILYYPDACKFVRGQLKGGDAA